MTASIPEKLRLDNAANIYPASMSKHYCSLYRMKVTLTEDIDKDILQKALLAASERIPTFRCKLKAGAFWWYLHRVRKDPQVRPVKPLKAFNFADQDGLLYRVSASGREIFLDVFHALTDGFGAMSFLLTLTGEYIHRRYGVRISYNGLALDPKDRPVYAEVEDSFKTVFTGRHGQLEKNVDAYHIRGAAMPFGAVKDLRVSMPMARVSEVCREYACTVTDLLTSAMLFALQEEHREDTSARKRSVLKVSVPVNLRPIYHSRTVRNFSSYVNLGMDIKDGYLTFPQIVAAVKAQKAHDLSLAELEPKIAANVELEEMLLVRCLPLAVKHPIIDIINLLHGDRFCSQTLSNMGRVDVPAEMVPYITDLDFILGRQRGNSGAASCVGYNGRLTLHLTRKISRDSFEFSLLRLLSSLDIPTNVTIDSLA
ncbi:MAG: hypothetical protein K6E61_04930 [Bacteroidales bacterium]|nr:hypothetical protein [Bacteroidales bacterium]